MNGFNAAFADLDDAGRAARYGRLAAAALERCDVGPAEAVFLQHNGGLAYRVETASGERFVLKIAEPTGEGGGEGPEALEAGLAWLAALARETELVVQEPVPDRDGALLAAVPFDDLAAPFRCSLQRWVEGKRVGHFAPEHARRVGAMVARLHRHGAGWLPAAALPAAGLEAAWEPGSLAVLHRVVGLGVVSAAEWAIVEAAAERIGRVMAGLGRDPSVWGAIHGDLHHGNLLFHGADVRPIDFGGFRRTHLAHDLGAALYHVMHQDADVRRALAEGYGAGWLAEEVAGAAVCAAAIDNLAFQVTIPRERASALFARNVRELADVFCRRFVGGRPFALA